MFELIDESFDRFGEIRHEGAFLMKRGGSREGKRIAGSASRTASIFSNEGSVARKGSKQSGDFQSSHSRNAAGETLHLAGEFLIHAAPGLIYGRPDQILQQFLI